MGFLGIFKRKKLIDEVFGELSYTTFKDSSKNFYDGEVAFFGKKMGIVVDADNAGPSQLQRDFYLTLKKDCPNIKAASIIPFLKGRLWEGYEIFDFDTEFEFDGLSIPRLPQCPTEWSICYFSFKLDHYVTIYFSDYRPTDILIDG